MVEPLDRVPQVFLSFPHVAEGHHHDYNAWHQLDHLPENLALPGVRHGQRWVLTPRAATHAHRDDALADVQYVAMYWFDRPVDASVDAWSRLGTRTLHEGRRPDLQWTQRRLLGMFEPVRGHVQPRVGVSLAALPYRPHAGVHVTVTAYATGDRPALQQHAAHQRTQVVPRLLAVDGVAGCWTFRSLRVMAATGPDGTRPDWADGDLRVRVCWLDGDLDATAARVDRVLDDPGPGDRMRRVFRGALATIQPWQWDWFEN